MIRSKAALALLTALGTATVAPTVHADIPQNIAIRVSSFGSGGEDGLAPIKIKCGCRETIGEIGIIENHGAMKGFSQNIKNVPSFINAGTVSRNGGYYNRN